MGSVYVCRKANDPNPGRLFTLKVIRQHTANRDLAIASFHHEALIGSCFSHPNSQTAIDEGSFEDQPYLVLPYVDGGCLADLLTPDARPAPAISVTIVLDLLAALDALHAATDRAGAPLGLVHGDVSPENLLVGTDGVARLADFGSTRITASGGQPHAFQISKPAWMPPEQFTGDGVDASSDLYSAGVLMWTALTGRQPFAADAYDQTVINVMRKNVLPPSALGGPASLDDVCMQAMSRLREQRFRVAGAMAAALRSSATADRLIASRAAVGQWVERAMRDELAQRRRLVAAMFDERAPASGGRPAVPAKTLYMPVAAPRRPRARSDVAFWAAIALAFALAISLTVSSWITHRRRVTRHRAAVSMPLPPRAPPPYFATASHGGAAVGRGGRGRRV